MILHISVLFSEVSDKDFISVLTDKRNKNIHSVLVNEFRTRGFKRCFHCTSPNVSNIALFDPESESKTIQQTIDSAEIQEDKFFQVMHFKTTWKSEHMGLKLAGRNRSSFSSKIFKPYKEIEEDAMQRRGETIGMDEGHRKDEESSEATTSGYGSRSTSSATTRYSRATARSSSVSSEFRRPLNGKELMDEVLRVVSRDLRKEFKELPKIKYNTVQAWLKTLQTKSTLIPEILPTEDLDRELGNIAEATVGPEGKDISIRSYQVQIPPKAVENPTKFKFRVSIEIDQLEYPQHLIPISLPLYCSPGDLDFREKITIRLATWLRKANNSPNSDQVPILVYTKRSGQDWKRVETTELTPTGLVEFKCDHFCANVAFIKKSDADKVLFKIEHILYRDDQGTYTSCHFLASDPFVEAMLRHLERSYKIVHSPTYTSLVRAGDKIRIALESKEPNKYGFKSEDSCMLKINEEFYVMNRRESFSLLLSPKPDPDETIEFTYVIGEKRFLIRDQLKDKPGDVANIIVKDGGKAEIVQNGVVIKNSEAELTGGPTVAKIPRLTGEAGEVSNSSRSEIEKETEAELKTTSSDAKMKQPQVRKTRRASQRERENE